MKSKPTLSTEDIQNIQIVIQKALEHKSYEPQIISLLQVISKLLQELKLKVDFDHERRIAVIEEYIEAQQ